MLFGLRGLAAYAYHAAALGYRDDAVSSFLHEGLAALADDEADADVLLPLSLKVGEVNLRCMELLDRANTETFGTPEPRWAAAGLSNVGAPCSSSLANTREASGRENASAIFLRT